MASLRDTRRRIVSVKNTRQITKAMKLVSGAKLKRATDAAVAARPYQKALQRTLERVVRGASDVEHPLLNVPQNTDDVFVVILTSDRGLCGGFNAQLCRFVQERLEKIKADKQRVTLLTYGKKARQYFEKRGYKVARAVVDIAPSTYAQQAEELKDRLIEMTRNNEYARVMLAYNEFRSVMTQKPSFEQLLPMRLEASAGAPTETVDYLFEPEGQGLVAELLPMALRTRLFQALLETQAGEQAARMTAMDNATRNAGDIIDSLTLQYNRARQAAITKELIEIVSGAEAL